MATGNLVVLALMELGNKNIVMERIEPLTLEDFIEKVTQLSQVSFYTIRVKLYGREVTNLEAEIYLSGH